MNVISVWTWTSDGGAVEPPVGDGDGEVNFRFQHRMYQKGWRNRFNRAVVVGIMLCVLVGG